MSILIRLLSAIGTLALGALIVWAVQAGDFGAAGAWLVGHPWGIVTLTDLYFGFLIAAVFIALIEDDWRWTLFWILPIPILGNVWTGLWLCLRAGRLLSRLRRSNGRTETFSNSEPSSPAD
ncbi:hypothetical protein [Maricaulis maris]|uniref:hypothetical protein n=1 Tax=Maricaulis maris TaxID=74318 RepID=UPI002924A813|nr:hypothetical protein MACH15_28090 [Maricaulis maris]